MFDRDEDFRSHPTSGYLTVPALIPATKQRPIICVHANGFPTNIVFSFSSIHLVLDRSRAGTVLEALAETCRVAAVESVDTPITKTIAATAITQRQQVLFCIQAQTRVGQEFGLGLAAFDLNISSEQWEQHTAVPHPSQKAETGTRLTGNRRIAWPSKPVTMIHSGEGATRYDVDPELIRGAASKYIIDNTQYGWNTNPHGTLEWTAFDNPTIESVLEYLEKSSYSRHAPNRPYPRGTPASGQRSSPQQGSSDNSAMPSSKPSPRPQMKLPVGPPLANSSHLANALQSETPASSSASGSDPKNPPSAERPVTKNRRTPEIIVHARIYNFARTNEFPALAEYSLGRLKNRVVYEFRSKKEIFPDLDTAVRLIYRDCQKFDSVDDRDPAMLYVTEFAVENFRLLDRQALGNLLREVGQFAVDVAWGLLDEAGVQEQKPRDDDVGESQGYIDKGKAKDEGEVPPRTAVW
ncbi:hypothetical protein BJX68DRAFT_272321 [Aspergillus pseudodeflectus]|uniref:Uncharacterized protein n=1 Tax=Aspergillus pseudodeflectus TaxID=176178 RepID=A0ABR4JG69_9EURO